VRKPAALAIAALCALFLAATAYAAKPRALWIEVDKQSKGKTTIAVTEDVARAILESESKDLRFSKHKGNSDELITKQMLLDVLNGDRESIKVRDEDEEATIHIYMSDLDVPRHSSGSGHIVLETFKDGRQSLRISLGDVDIEKSDEDGNSASFHLDWVKCVPFLKHDGGAVYINNEDEDTQVWLYVE